MDLQYPTQDAIVTTRDHYIFVGIPTNKPSFATVYWGWSLWDQCREIYNRPMDASWVLMVKRNPSFASSPLGWCFKEQKGQKDWDFDMPSSTGLTKFLNHHFLYAAWRWMPKDQNEMKKFLISPWWPPTQANGYIPSATATLREDLEDQGNQTPSAKGAGVILGNMFQKNNTPNQLEIQTLPYDITSHLFTWGIIRISDYLVTWHIVTLLWESSIEPTMYSKMKHAIYAMLMTTWREWCFYLSREETSHGPVWNLGPRNGQKLQQIVEKHSDLIPKNGLLPGSLT